MRERTSWSSSRSVGVELVKGREVVEMTSFLKPWILAMKGGCETPPALLSIVRRNMQANEYIIVLSFSWEDDGTCVLGRISSRSDFSSRRRTASGDVIYAKKRQ